MLLKLMSVSVSVSVSWERKVTIDFSKFKVDVGSKAEIKDALIVGAPPPPSQFADLPCLYPAKFTT